MAFKKGDKIRISLESINEGRTHYDMSGQSARFGYFDVLTVVGISGYGSIIDFVDQTGAVYEDCPAFQFELFDTKELLDFIKEEISNE